MKAYVYRANLERWQRALTESQDIEGLYAHIRLIHHICSIRLIFFIRLIRELSGAAPLPHLC